MAGGDHGSVGGSARPCALPRIWGRLHGSLLFCFRKDVARVWHCAPGWERRTLAQRTRKHTADAIAAVETACDDEGL